MALLLRGRPVLQKIRQSAPAVRAECEQSDGAVFGFQQGKAQGTVEEKQKNIVFLLILLQNALALLRQAEKRAALPDEPLLFERLHHAVHTGARYAQHDGDLHRPCPAVFPAEPSQREEIAQARARKRHGLGGAFCASPALWQTALCGQFEQPQAH